MKYKRPTAGVTGKGGTWRTKPPDAESAVWGRFSESAGKAPHLSGARGVGQVLQDGFELELNCLDTSRLTSFDLEPDNFEKQALDNPNHSLNYGTKPPTSHYIFCPNFLRKVF